MQRDLFTEGLTAILEGTHFTVRLAVSEGKKIIEGKTLYVEWNSL
jgi:hypothetical protein